jgi:Domain of unknown function (DUF4175)
MDNQAHPTTELNDALTERLAQLAERQRWLRVLAGLLGAILVVLVLGLLGIIILGVVGSAPTMLCWCAALILWIAAAYLLLRQLRPAFESVELRDVAGLVEQREPEHEERITSAVNFSENQPDAHFVSQEMVDHVIREAQQDAQKIDSGRIVSFKSVLRRGLYCLPVLLAWTILWAVIPQTMSQGLQRVLFPWQGAAEQPALTLLIKPGDATVGQGDSIQITADDAMVRPNAPSESYSVELQYVSGGGRQLAMTPTSPSSRGLDLPDIESGFRYRVFSADVSSPWYTVQMTARPQITALELHYKYPAYTGLPDRITNGPDWKIQAVVGSQVRVLINTSQELSALSHLSIAASDTTPEMDIPLAQTGDLKYQATLNVQTDTTYQIQLANPQGVAGAVGHPWPIVAVPDQPPSIAIVSPIQSIKVRPDDMIPVLFTASDDYGLTHVQAMVSVENSAGRVYEIPLPAGNPANFSGQWRLSVANELMLANQPDAAHIDYYLQAVDNRFPSPQQSHTAIYELIIDSHLPYGYQQQVDKSQSEQLRQALAQAIKNLQDARRQVNALRTLAPTQPLTDQQSQRAENAANEVAQTARDLNATAQAAQNTPLSELATQAGKIADDSVAPAADKIAAATLSDTQQPQQRSADLASSAEALSQATDQLQKLQRQIALQSGQEQMADNVSKLAQQQQDLAQQIADNPNSSDALQRQQQLAKSLQQLIKQNNILQTPAAAQVQPQLDALKNQTAQIIQQQSALNNQMNGQIESSQLAQKQALLDKDIQQLNQQSTAADSKTSSTAPTDDAMNAAVANLANQQFAPAQADQQTIAGALSKLQHQLNHLAGLSDQQQLSQNQASQQNAAETQQMQNVSKDVSAVTQQLQNAGDPQGLTQGLAQTPKVAAELKALAQQLSSRDTTPQEQNDLTQAVDEASQAANAASWNNSQQAAQSLQQAQTDLQQAQQLSVPSPQQLPPADQLNQLAQQAQGLAVRQQQLAEQSAQLLQQAQAAGQATPTTAANLPPQISSTANQAGQIAQQVQNTSPDLAQNLAQAQKQMQEAQNAQEQANQNLPDTSDAAQNQQLALNHMQAAQTALNGAANSPEMQNVPQFNNALANANNPQNTQNPDEQTNQESIQNQPQPSTAQNGQANQQTQNQDAQPNQTNQQNLNAQQNQSGQQPAQSGQGQSGQSSAQNNQGQSQSEQSNQSGQSAQSGQGQSQSDQQNQNGESAQSGQGQSGQQTPNAQGQGLNAQSNQSGQSAQSGQGQQEGNGQQTAQGGQGSAEQHMMSAAQEIQNALHLQQQAASGNAAAAQQAAEALAGAANDLAQAKAMSSGQQSGSTPGNSLALSGPNNPMQIPGLMPTPASNTPSQPGQNGTMATGASAAQNTTGQTPAAVFQMGISPAQWRDLGPLEQQQLINAARQNLPPGYEEMIRDYYIRLSEMNSNE